MKKWLIILFFAAFTQAALVPFSPQQFNDATWGIFDNADPTKRIVFELSGLTTGTTRIITIRDANGTPLYNIVEDTTPQLGGDLDGQSTYDLTNMVDGTFIGDVNVGDDLMVGGQIFVPFTGTAANPSITHIAFPDTGIYFSSFGVGHEAMFISAETVKAAAFRYNNIYFYVPVNLETVALIGDAGEIIGSDGVVNKARVEDSGNWDTAYTHIGESGASHSLLGATAGTVSPSKAIIVDSSNDIDYGTGDLTTSGTYNTLSILPVGSYTYLSGDGLYNSGLTIGIPINVGGDFFYGWSGTEHHKFGSSGQVEISDDGFITATGTVQGVTQAEFNTLTDNSIANALHRHTELVASDGSPDPALSVDEAGRVGIGTADPEGTLELRTGNSIMRIRDTGDTNTATTSYIEFGGTTDGSWRRTGYVGDASSGDTHIRLCAEANDLILGDSSGASVLTLSGGDVIITGDVNLVTGTIAAARGVIHQTADGDDFGGGTDDVGLRIFGFDDKSSDRLQISLDRLGHSAITASENLFFVVGGTVAAGSFGVGTGLGQFQFNNNADFRFGSSGTKNAKMRWSTGQTNAALMIGLSSYTGAGKATRTVIICDVEDITYNFAHPIPLNPTLFIHSEDRTTDEWMSFAHDGNDGVVDVGIGVLNLPASEIGDDTNDTVISSTGVLTMTGDARVKTQIPIDNANLGKGASKATQVIVGNYNAWAFGINDDSVFTFHLPHEWAVGTDVVLNMDWYIDEAGGDEIKWEISWSATPHDSSEAIDAPTHTGSSDTGDIVIPATVKFLTTNALTIPNASLSAGDQVGVTLKRIAITDGTNPANEPAVVDIHIEFTKDKLGEAL